MRDRFPGYYRPTDDDLRSAWSKCLFVIDTNVLLNFYRYSSEVRDELSKILNDLGERVWVPHHAALEFQRNRVSVIEEQVRKFKSVKDYLNGVSSDLSVSFGKLQLRDRHSLIDPEAIIKDFNEVVEKYQAELADLEIKQVDVHKPDDIRVSIDALLDGKIGDAPNGEWLESVSREAAVRFSANVPPGYLDEKKGDSVASSFTFDGNNYQTKFGDLIIWKQILDKVKSDSDKFVIFITDDEKPDWWWISEGNGRKKLGPRPELVEEIIRESGAEGFYIYTTKSFLVSAKKYLEADVSESSIEQVADVVSSDPGRVSAISGSLARTHPVPVGWTHDLGNLTNIILRWVVDQNPSSSVSLNRGWPDMVVDSLLGAVGYEVFFVTTPSSVKRRLAEEVAKASLAVNEGRFACFEIVAVAAGRDACDAVFAMLKGHDVDLPIGVIVTVGVVESLNGQPPQFLPAWRFANTDR